MKKRIGLIVAVGLVASVASLQAAPCSSVSNLADLIALTTTGCTLDDKVFSNFAYTPGAGAPTLSEIATSSGISGADPLLGVQLRVSESVQSVIPEPATLALTGVGLLALGLLGRRRKSKN